MTSYNQSGLLQINAQPYQIARKTVTFTGAAGAGAVGTVAVATVTGRVMLIPWTGYVTTTLDDAGGTSTINFGTAANTNTLSPNPTGDADAYVAGTWMVGGAGAPATSVIAVNPALFHRAVDDDLILTIGSQAVTVGVIEFTFWWTPISVDGLLVPA